MGAPGFSHAAAKFAAFTGATTPGFSFIPNPRPACGAVFIGGIALPLVNNPSRPAAVAVGAANGAFLKLCPGPPAARSNGQPPENDLIQATGGSMLTASDVQEILDDAEATAKKT